MKLRQGEQSTAKLGVCWTTRPTAGVRRCGAVPAPPHSKEIYLSNTPFWLTPFCDGRRSTLTVGQSRTSGARRFWEAGRIIAALAAIVSGLRSNTVVDRPPFSVPFADWELIQ